MHMLSSLLPTQRLYQQPSIGAYETAQQAWINQVFSDHYFTLSDEDRWDTLMGQFASMERLSGQAKSLYTTFQEQRKQVVKNNRYILQLPQCLAYFEHFYFLFCADQVTFKLTELEKEELLTQIEAALHVCESGKYTRFEAVLQKARKDINWISHELHQQRQLIVQQIADEFNAQHIDLGVHSVMQMHKLAQSHNLGITPSTTINDAHLNVLSTAMMTTFFTENAPGKFFQYEQDVIFNLTQHVVWEIKKFCGQRTEPIYLKSSSAPGELNDFYDLLNRFFVDFPFHKIMENDYDEHGNEFYILNKEYTYFSLIQQLIQEKVIKDGYFVDFFQLDPHQLPTDVRLQSNIELKKLVEVATALEPKKIAESPDVQKYLETIYFQNEELLVNYFFLFAKTIISMPSAWSYLPESIKINRTVMSILATELSNQLLLAVENNEQEIDPLLTYLWAVVQGDANYLLNLSPQLMAKKSIVLLLVAKNGLLWQRASDELKKDADVLRAAINQNPRVYYLSKESELRSEYEKRRAALPPDIQSHFPPSNVVSSVDILREHLVKIQTIHDLLNTPYISSGKLIKLVQSITPGLLVKIVTVRKNAHLPDLPHCNTHCLNQFYDLAHQHLWESNGYLAVKENMSSSLGTSSSGTYLSTAYHYHVVKKAIAQSDYWFLAFIAYQKQIPAYFTPFESLWDVMWQLKLSAKSLLLLLLSVGGFFVKSLAKILLYLVSPFLLIILPIITWGVLWVLLDLLIFNFGFLYVFAIEAIILMFSLRLFLDSYLEVLRVMLLILICAPSLIELVFFFPLATLPVASMSIVALVIIVAMFFNFIIPAMIKLISIITFNELSWSEVSDIMKAADAFLSTIISARRLGDSFVEAYNGFLSRLTQTWPALFLASFAPLITKACATFLVSTTYKPTDDEALVLDVENSIFRLLTSDEPSARQKAELLEILWRKIQEDVAVTTGEVSLKQGLSKRYPIAVGENAQASLSFWDVAASRRDSSNFQANKQTVSNSGFSFFGFTMKTTTAKQVEHYVEFSGMAMTA